MKNLLSLSAVLGAMLMFASGSVLAQSNGHGRGHGNSQGQDEQDDGYRRNSHDRDRYERDDDRGRYDRRYVRDDDRARYDRRYIRDDGPPGHYKNWHDRGRHEGWYKRGGYLPVEYRTRYVVTDWRHAHLREPPHGYHWVRSDNGDFLLVAIATGVIVDLLLNQ